MSDSTINDPIQKEANEIVDELMTRITNINPPGTKTVRIRHGKTFCTAQIEPDLICFADIRSEIGMWPNLNKFVGINIEIHPRMSSYGLGCADFAGFNILITKDAGNGFLRKHFRQNKKGEFNFGKIIQYFEDCCKTMQSDIEQIKGSRKKYELWRTNILTKLKDTADLAKYFPMDYPLNPGFDCRVTFNSIELTIDQFYRIIKVIKEN